MKPVNLTPQKPPDHISAIFTVPARTGDKVLQFLIDTGADVSILPRNLFSRDCSPCNQRLIAANGNNIVTYGKLRLKFRIADIDKIFEWDFILADVNRPILGSDFLAHEDVKINCRQSQISIGNCIINSSIRTAHTGHITVPSDGKHFFKIETSGPPIAQRPRRLGPHLLQIVRNEFDQLLAQGIIRRSTSPWASPIVVVKKRMVE